VVLDRTLTDAEIGSNVLAWVPGQHALHDVSLSRREPREVTRNAIRRSTMSTLC
jgi:hypothetical protein